MDPAQRVIGGASDGVQRAWMLAWTQFAVTHGLDPLHTSYLSVPGHQINLMQNNMGLLWALVVWPVAALAGPLQAFNLAVVLSLATTCVVASLVFGRYVRHWQFAWLAGIAFGLSPFALAEADLGHLTWTSLWAVPLVLLLGDKILVRQRGRPVFLGLALGAVLSAQLLMSEELFASTILVALVVAGAAILFRPRAALQRWRFVLRALGAASLVFVPIATGPLVGQFLGPGPRSLGPNVNPLLMSADLLGYVVPGQHQLLAPAGAASIVSQFTGDYADTAVYLGLPLIALVLFGLVRYHREPAIRWGAGIAAVGLVLSLGSRLHICGRILSIPLPWAIASHIPLLDMAWPSRFVVFALLGSCLTLAIVSDRLWDVNAGRLRWATISSVGLVGLSLAPQSTLYTPTALTPQFFESSQVTVIPYGSVAVVAPVPTGGNQADSMLWQAASGFRFKMPWGYVLQEAPKHRTVVQTPANLVTRAIDSAAAGRTPAAAEDVRVLSQLRRWHVRTVVVGPMKGRSALVRWWTEALRRPPHWYGSVAIWPLAPA